MSGKAVQFLLVVVLVISGLSCNHIRPNSDKAADILDAGLILGSWTRVKREPIGDRTGLPDRKPGSRTISFDPDGTYCVQVVFPNDCDPGMCIQYRIRDQVIVLHWRQFHPGNIVTSRLDPVTGQPGVIETGKPDRWEERTCEIRIERLSQNELVLIENEPGWAFYPEVPIQQARNTYKRVDKPGSQ
jgi:hypothetical protein